MRTKRITTLPAQPTTAPTVAAWPGFIVLALLVAGVVALVAVAL